MGIEARRRVARSPCDTLWTAFILGVRVRNFLFSTRMKQFVQKINNAPFVQKLRAVEQRRMSRLSTRRMQFKESTSKVVTTIDTKAKEAFKQALKEYAEDITYVVDALDEEDETSSE